jgi:hypothetical protein
LKKKGGSVQAAILARLLGKNTLTAYGRKKFNLSFFMKELVRANKKTL